MLTELTQSNVTFKWFDAYEVTFQVFKRTLTSTFVLTLLIEGLDFDTFTNASHQGLKVVLSINVMLS